MLLRMRAKLADLAGIDKKSFALGALFALVSCGSVQYRWYTMDLVRYEGKLLGPTPSDDVNFARCAPTEDDKAPCIAMFTPEFENMLADGRTCQVKLNDCQKRCRN